MIMKAVVQTEPGAKKLAYIDVPEPEKPGPGMILAEVKYCGICGSDMHKYHGTFPVKPPVIIGHEYSAVVLETGPGVSRFVAGDKISSEVPVDCCGKCRYCLSGDIQHCIDRHGMGGSRNGCFTKYVLIPEMVTHKLPDDLDLKLGAVVEPVTTCAHCIDITGIKATDTVVIGGPGPIGLIMCQLAKAEGAFVIMTGINQDEKRLRFAKELGADMVINTQQIDALPELKKATSGYGIDTYIECSGNVHSAVFGIKALRCMGKYTQMGVLGTDALLPLDMIANKELKFTGVRSENYTSWEHALDYIRRGKVNLEKLVTHEFGLDQWLDAFELCDKKTGLKVLMHPVE
jgi:L-iditol 2-dehydrogenase